jgi:hypothetical protein
MPRACACPEVLAVRVRGTGMRVGLTSTGRVVLGESARVSGRAGVGVGVLSSISLGWDKVRVRLNGEPVPMGVVGRLSEIEGRGACRLGLGMALGRGEKAAFGTSSRWGLGL